MANQIVESQTKSTGLVGARPQNSRENDQFLTFTLASDQQGLLPTSQLLEIVRVDLSEITAIAGLSPSVMGIYNWRGDVTWVVDLASLLGYAPLYTQAYRLKKFQDKCHVLFLKSQDMVIGIAVQQVGQVMKCDSSKLQKSGISFSNPILADVCHGYWLNPDNEALLVLDGHAIMRNVQ
ncbi:chemotaxis protein CheW [Pseudanabaena mucicola]|uniref:Chemotaxis protein CheW n=1 Tax=Pseudanabaena mucicola FACHB-723 TaxID=2692860 RepID=A0ABR7ZUS4_9CYAN|nr:chemotaxis protein CheW [Pseudanabaena mucicola]MBD2187168.1 chemotaxis protein CheW [Pseudanabaena mucicola FACHB-723]